MRTQIEVVCERCGKPFLRAKASVDYHHGKKGLRILCSKQCFGLSRRDNKTQEQKKAEKSAYDAKYRERNREKRKARSRTWYKANRNPEKEREIRKAKMPQHVEYCRRPEYKKWKQNYDLDYRAREFGEFSEAYKLLMLVNREIKERTTRTEIYTTNGTLNKAQIRKREYARTNSNQS